jgi:hypothetical protein
MTTESVDGDEDRSRGILSPTDREFLAIPAEQRRDEMNSRQAEYRRRRSIRNRVRNAALDFPLVVQGADADIFTAAFAADGADTVGDVPKVQKAMPDGFQFLLRAVLADQPHRPIKTTRDLAAVLDPVISEFERGIQRWLNTQRMMTADFEITPEIRKVQTITGFIDELESRRLPVTGKDRLRIHDILARAGIDEHRILELLGEDPATKTDSDADPESNYSVEELAELPTEKLSELLAAGVISVESHTAAIEAKAESGNI